MGKTAFVFPGQGAQYVGMGRDFYETYPVSREMFDRASAVTGLDLPALCFEENDRLDVTEYTQIAMLTVEAAILAAVRERGIFPDVTAGLSLGEYGALIASGVLSSEDAFRVVRKRGIYMQSEVPSGCAMAAVIGMDSEKIEEICEKTEGIVSIANYNCPGQIVITGEEKAVMEAGEALKMEGARRIIQLKVSGPFHSEMLKGAGEKLGKVLDQVSIHDIQVPYLSNVTADYVTDREQIPSILMRQVFSPVRWQQSVERMLADGTDIFLEIGPGKTLTGFLRKINRGAAGINIETAEDLEKAAETLENRSRIC
ncbi:MAG: ACP S-malonyltransferase [Lachnospiraceae bacterium]|nr:ACP S-malonyltransferase [Lachnospiraceae bacterium]